MTVISARKNDEGKVVIKSMRDAFLDLDISTKRFLKLSNVNYIEKDDKIFIVGEEALHVANMFNREVRRPLSQGVISSAEIDSYDILSLMIEQLLGKPKCENEICYFSVPASPIDNPGQDVIFHEKVFKRLIGELGYDARPFNEASAICFSEANKDGFTSLNLSFGAGLVNCSIVYRTLSIMEFSIARSGDWIDACTAKATNTTASRIAVLKEQEADLMNFSQGDPSTLRSREALLVYYRALIDYVLDSIEKEFQKVQSKVLLPEPIPLIIAGGTSLAKNFVPFFKQEFEKRTKFPIAIKEIRHAENPLNAIANGLLVNACINYD
jgi:hypothetical protein